MFLTITIFRVKKIMHLNNALNALLNEIQIYKFKIFSIFDNAKTQCIVCFDR